MFDPERSKEELLDFSLHHAEMLKKIKSERGLTPTDYRPSNQLLVWVDSFKNPKQLPEIMIPLAWWKRPMPKSSSSVTNQHWQEMYDQWWKDVLIIDAIFPDETVTGQVNTQHPFGSCQLINPNEIKATLLKRLLTATELRLVTEFIIYEMSHPRPRFFPFYDSKRDIGMFFGGGTDPRIRWKL